jgi:hypothetical protein
MKLYILLLCIFIGKFQGFAQNNFNRYITLAGINKIEGDFEWGDIVVKNWDGNDLKITGNVDINLGESNDAFVLETEIQGDALLIKSTIRDWKSLPKYVTVRKGQEKVMIRAGDQEEIDWQTIKAEHGVEASSYSVGVLVDIKLTILVPARPALQVETGYGSLEVMECENPLDLKCIYGHLIAHLGQRKSKSDCNLKSIYSFVDVSVPENSDFGLTLETHYGKIYSDLDITIDTGRSINRIFESKVVGNLNGGNNPLNLQAIYNNIYLRKRS